MGSCLGQPRLPVKEFSKEDVVLIDDAIIYEPRLAINSAICMDIDPVECTQALDDIHDLQKKESNTFSAKSTEAISKDLTVHNFEDFAAPQIEIPTSADIPNPKESDWFVTSADIPNSTEEHDWFVSGVVGGANVGRGFTPSPIPKIKTPIYKSLANFKDVSQKPASLKASTIVRSRLPPLKHSKIITSISGDYRNLKKVPAKLALIKARVWAKTELTSRKRSNIKMQTVKNFSHSKYRELKCGANFKTRLTPSKRKSYHTRTSLPSKKKKREHIILNIAAPAVRSVSSENEVQAFISLVCKQLPSMPREYVQELWDSGDQRIICAFDGTSIVGGAMWKCFRKEKFGELTFIVVHSKKQDQGIGRSIMMEVKRDCERIQLKALLTYADCTASDFFSKIGFTTRICIKKKVYNNKILHYHRSTLMCHQFLRSARNN